MTRSLAIVAVLLVSCSPSLELGTSSSALTDDAGMVGNIYVGCYLAPDGPTICDGECNSAWNRCYWGADASTRPTYCDSPETCETQCAVRVRACCATYVTAYPGTRCLQD